MDSNEWMGMEISGIWIDELSPQLADDQIVEFYLGFHGKKNSIGPNRFTRWLDIKDSEDELMDFYKKCQEFRFDCPGTNFEMYVLGGLLETGSVPHETQPTLPTEFTP